jgi:hypothetical protein
MSRQGDCFVAALLAMTPVWRPDLDIAEQIRQKARELLESGSVVGVIGYERGTL